MEPVKDTAETRSSPFGSNELLEAIRLSQNESTLSVLKLLMSSCHLMSSHVITSSTSSTSSTSVFSLAFCIFYEELMKKTSIVVTCRILKRFGGFANYSIQIISWFKWVVRLSQSKEPKKCMHDSVFQNACLSHESPLWTTPNLTFYLLLDLPKSLFALLLEIKRAFTKKKSRRAIMKKTSWQESRFWALRELKNLRATSDTESLWTCTECPQNTYIQTAYSRHHFHLLNSKSKGAWRNCWLSTVLTATCAFKDLQTPQMSCAERCQWNRQKT